MTKTEALSLNPPNSGGRVSQAAPTTAASQQNKQPPQNQQHQQQKQVAALDYVGTKRSVMQLFSLPYSDKSVSVGIHNVEGCLMIDADPTLNETIASAAGSSDHDHAYSKESGRSMRDAGRDFRGRQRQTSPAVAAPRGEDLQPMNGDNNDMDESSLSMVALQQQSAALAAISTMIDPGPQQSLCFNDESNNQAVNLFEQTCAEPREYLPWDFQGMNMLVGSDALVYLNAKNDSSLTVRVEDAETMRKQLEHYQPARMSAASADGDAETHQQPGKRTYSEALRTRQLIMQQGSDDSADSTDNGSITVVSSGCEKSNTDSIISNPNKNATKAGPVSSLISADELDGVQLHTSIIHSNNLVFGGTFSVSSEPSPDSDKLASPMYTLIDSYLDQLITNVPQLALVLREKGFVQSVKLMQTQQIPEAFLQSATFDTKHPFEVINTSKSPTGQQSPAASVENIFDPNIMQMNAASLLTFLRANCTKDNSTYLLHREAGQQNIQLFDVSAISTQRQQKWIWWLAMMSYRFSQRLRHLSVNMAMNKSKKIDPALQRSFRARERSLLQNVISLLEEFTDLGGQPHELLVAEVCEKLADTFLRADKEATSRPVTDKDKPSPGQTPVPATITPTVQQRYSKARPDSLNKAQDYLAKGISVLWKVWQKAVDDLPTASIKMSRRRRRQHRVREDLPKGLARVVSITDDSSSSDEGEKETKDHESEALQVKAETLATRLIALHHKMIDISLRLSELHLNAYWSSSAMQALRTAARKMADAVGICLSLPRTGKKPVMSWMHGSQLQYVRLWELCGHFARSFAADELWRERGHAAGDDVISVLRDVESAFPWGSHDVSTSDAPTVEDIFYPYIKDLVMPSGDLIDLTGLVEIEGNLEAEHAGTARKLLNSKHQLQNDRRRVLVAASFAYSRATLAYESSIKFQNWGKQTSVQAKEGSDECALLNILRQRQGDANNELAKLLLNELRAVLAAFQNPASNSKESEAAVEPLLSSALYWFKEGLKSFNLCKDLRNSTLLSCNICQCYKIKANANFASSRKSNASKSDKAGHADACLKEAIGSLQAAHEKLGERDVDPMAFDMVSNELAATYLVLGVRRRQALIGSGNTPVILQVMRLNPGETRSIIDPMEKALHIYDESGNANQAAAAHYQLALFYSKTWTCQRDETKTREMLSAAFSHYNAALTYLSRSIQGNEQTFVLLCLDSSSLYSTVSGEECLCLAFARCLDARDAFSRDSIDLSRPATIQKEWLQTMTTLAASVEERLFKTLRSLLKLEDSNLSAVSKKYKDLYRIALTTKMSAANASKNGDEKALVAMHALLQAVKEAHAP